MMNINFENYLRTMNLLLNVWSFFRFSLNFDPVKKLLKMQYHIDILMKKGIILSKIHVKMKSFIPPFSSIERN